MNVWCYFVVSFLLYPAAPILIYDCRAINISATNSLLLLIWFPPLPPPPSLPHPPNYAPPRPLITPSCDSDLLLQCYQYIGYKFLGSKQNPSRYKNSFKIQYMFYMAPRRELTATTIVRFCREKGGGSFCYVGL